MSDLKDIIQLVTDGKTKPALQALLEWVEARVPEQRNHVNLLLSNFNKNAQDFLVSLKTTEQYEVEHTRIKQGILTLVDDLSHASSSPGGATTAPRPALHEYHAYTCDRVTHSDMFQAHFSQPTHWRHVFYYLYGGELQSHEGFFRRIAFHLEGRLLDYLNPALEASCQALQLEMTFEFSKQLDLYKQNILRALFTTLGVSPNEHEPLRERNLAYVIERSPRLGGLCENDFVCVFLHVSRYHWDNQLTPEAARWFIQEFCAQPPPEGKPRLLFFFAVEYDEADTAVRDRLTASIEQSDHILSFPELDMVERRDVALWLDQYKQIAPHSRERRDLLEQHFGQQEQHYMEDVELTLRKIIDHYNNQLLS